MDFTDDIDYYGEGICEEWDGNKKFRLFLFSSDIGRNFGFDFGVIDENGNECEEDHKPWSVGTGEDAPNSKEENAHLKEDQTESADSGEEQQNNSEEIEEQRNVGGHDSRINPADTCK
jgi:hypothetical protein